MNKEIKDKWVKALRSGEYKQGRLYLQRDNLFCCLGVLCKVLDVPNIVSDYSNNTMTFLLRWWRSSWLFGRNGNNFCDEY